MPHARTSIAHGGATRLLRFFRYSAHVLALKHDSTGTHAEKNDNSHGKTSRKITGK